MVVYNIKQLVKWLKKKPRGAGSQRFMRSFAVRFIFEFGVLAFNFWVFGNRSPFSK
jgi:hypothetical protein